MAACIASGGAFTATKQAAAQAGLFPFIVNPWDVLPDNITNISGWLDKPAGKAGFVRAEGDRFVTADGTPIRFLGVNLSYGAGLPTHQQAKVLADRLSRFGINLVRFHNLDGMEAPDGLFKAGVYPRELDPEMLDRLDYFVAQLKERGIYSNFNLKTARTLRPEEGFPALEGRPTYDKGIDLFDPGMIAEHKRIYRELLLHVNPYTGNAYVDEPALAQLEISNENGIFYIWQNGQLDRAPRRYLEKLDALWTKWLEAKYGSTESLSRAWGGAGTFATDGVELVPRGDLTRGVEGWYLQDDSVSIATFEAVPGAGPELPDGTRLAALKVTVTRAGRDAWIPQAMVGAFEVEAGQAYRVSFWARVDGPVRQMRANTSLSGPPYTNLWFADFAVGPEWRHYEFDFRAPAGTAGNPKRVMFTRLVEGNTYWIAGVSVQRLAESTGLGLPEGESLEAGVSRPTHADLVSRTDTVQRDYVEFLRDVDRAYFEDMYRFLKEELGAKSLVTGSQVPLTPQSVQASTDYVDTHLYFKHPQFPGQSWDSLNWYIENVSMVNSDGGTIPGIAGLRVAGKPFVLSEYNHPAPNTYGSEGFLLVGAYGAYQDWSGIVAFDWSRSRDYDAVRITNYFNIKGHSTKLVTLPAVHALFVRGDVEVGRKLAHVLAADEIALYSERSQTSLAHNAWSRDVPRLWSLEGRLARLVPGIEPREEPTAGPAGDGRTPLAAPPGPVYVSDTGELVWDRTNPERSLVTIDAKRSKASIGYGEGRTIAFKDGVALKPGPTRQDGWSAITLTVMEGDGFDGPAKVLVTATGFIQNTGMVWEDLGQGRVTLRNRWGSAPVMVEGIPARIRLPVPAPRVKVYALDMIGNRGREVPVLDDGGRAAFDIGPVYRTLWYEVVIEPQ